MAAVEELGGYLQTLQGMKAPGIGKKAIEAINTLCIVNVGSDTALVDKIAAHFKTTPSTHKLGVLYVIDSVTRQWIEKAKQTGQALIGSAAAPGTYAHGVYKMTEVLPGLVSDIVVTAPDAQKEKITKLFDIWETASTFPADMIADFKRKMQGPIHTMRTFPSANGANGSSNVSASTTAANNASYAANIALPQVAAAAAPQNGAPPFAQQAQQAPAPPQYSTDQLAAMLGFPAPANSVPQQQLSSQMQALSLPQLTAAPQVVAPPQHVQPTHVATAPVAPALSGDLTQQLQVIAQLVQSGLSPDQIAQVMSAMGLPMPPVPLPTAAAPPATAPPQQIAPTYPPADSVAQQPSPGANGQYEHTKRRSRSRSPARDSSFKRRRTSPLNRRESPVYGVYDPDAAQTETNRPMDFDRRGGRNGYGKGWNRNRRSPPGRQAERVASPHMRGGAAPTEGPPPKYIQFDNSLPPGHIRVLSRTLFVGGVAATESEIRDIFSRFGRVQTCIVNIDKRHGFVKMVNRPDAVNAKASMDLIRDPDVQSRIRSTKWGVGFGPRECSDYSTGVSVVPISALTEADKRWLLTAEYGGTGGRPIEGGMELEEPDIEIGAGVSSKAISRRIEAGSMNNNNNNNSNGKKHNRDHGNHGNHHGHGKTQQNHHQRQPQQQHHQQQDYAQESYGYNRPSPPTKPAYQQNYQQSRHRESGPEPPRAKTSGANVLRPEPNTVGVPPAVPTFGFSLPGFNIR